MAVAILADGLITDAVRAAGLDGDGRAAPDSSVGIWPAATNGIPNPNAATNTTGWVGVTATLGRVTTGALKFGATAFEITSTAGGTYYMRTAAAFLPNGVSAPLPDGSWTYSVWAYASGGSVGQSLRLLIFFNGGAFADEFYFKDAVLVSGWAQYHIIVPALAHVDRATVNVYAQVLGGTIGDKVRLSGFMLTPDTATLVPYATTARASGRVRVPVAGLSPQRGWVAIRFRSGWGNGVPADPAYLWSWRVDDAHRIDLRWESGRWKLRRSSPAGTEEAAINGAVAHGQDVTIVGRWTPTGVSVSARGQPFRETDTLVLDDTFTRSVSGGWGTPLPLGAAWTVNGAGAANAAVDGNHGKVTTNQTIYGYQVLAEKPSRMWARIIFQAGASQGIVALLSSVSATSNIEEMIHFIAGNTSWNQQLTETTAAALETLISGSYPVALATDGVTTYDFCLVPDGDAIYLELPDGSRRTVGDARISAFTGPWISYECWTSGGAMVPPMFDAVQAEIPVGAAETTGAFVPEIAATYADIGGAGDGTGHLHGEALWVMAGTGPLTDADAVALAELTDPSFATPALAALPALGWKAETATLSLYGDPTQVPIPSRVATTGAAFAFAASTATQQSIPWRRGDVLIARNVGASGKTVTIADNPAGSSATGTINADPIAAGAYRVYPRYARQDNDVLLVTSSHSDVEFAVIGPAAHSA